MLKEAKELSFSGYLDYSWLSQKKTCCYKFKIGNETKEFPYVYSRELENALEIGDSIVKFKDQNLCKVIKPDTSIICKFIYDE